MPARPDADYPIEEYMAFQRREWVAERIGWCILVLIAAVALSGLLAYGPLSRAKASDPAHRLTVEYERFERLTVSTLLTLHVAAQTTPFAIRIESDFASKFQIDSITPRPLHSALDKDGLTLTFQPAQRGNFTVVIWYRSRRMGLTAFTASLDALTPVRGTILVYP